MKNINEELFSIEELEARLEMTTITLADGTVLEGATEEQEAEAASCRTKCQCGDPKPF